jgi:hypothetical protein
MFKAIYEFIRNTSPVPICQLTTIGAKNYFNPEMFRKLEGYFDVFFESTVDHFEYMDDETSDRLLHAYYRNLRFSVDTATRAGCPENEMPLLSRGNLGMWMVFQLARDPVLSYD